MFRVSLVVSQIILFTAGAVSCVSMDAVSESSKKLSNSVSESLESISDSLGSISRSISRSSGSGGDSAARFRFEMDVRTFTASYLESGSTDGNEYLRDMGRIAERHGITDWEGDELTYMSMGEGIKKAGVSMAEFQVFSERFDSQESRDLLRAGYDSYPSRNG